MRTRNGIGFTAAVIFSVGGACGLLHAQVQQGADARLIGAVARGERIEIVPAVRAELDEIDRRANQKDALWSGLSWYTDLDAALAEAERLDRPVLSLRMLGRLDEEYSCANSRFFRAALYANAQVSAFLRDHFVLHWESVRPAPRITIDYGDGRVIESTITGNSIHYVLSPDGEVVDALPGLYGPGVFLEALQEALRNANGLDTRQRDRYTVSPLVLVEPEVTEPSAFYELTTVSFDDNAAAHLNDGRFERIPEELAQRAMMATFSKRVVEIPALHAVLGLEAHPVDVRIPLHAAGYMDRCRLDAHSISLIRTQMGDANARSVSRTIASFEQSMAADTALNEETIRPAIMRMFENDPSLRNDLARLNERVYAEVFMTPSDDAWLGLRPAVAYTGLWTREGTPEGG